MYSFTGNHFEIAQQFGELYKSWGVSFSDTNEQDLLKNQVGVYEQYAPEILEEIRGLAHAYGASFSQVASRYLLGEIFFIRSFGRRCCSIGGFCDQAGKNWVVRNYDWHPVVGEHFQRYSVKLPNRSYMAISDMGMVNEASIPKKHHFFLPWDVINHCGLFIGITFAYCWKEQYGIANSHVTRLIAERCKTVDEALSFFENIPVASGKNFFIADRTGDMAVVQHGVTSFDVRKLEKDGILALTNHYVGPLEAEDQIHTTSPNSTTWKRYDRLANDMRILSQKDDVSFHDLCHMMNGEMTPVFQKNPDTSTETCWTLLMNLQENDVRLIGNPHHPDSRMEKMILDIF